MATAEGPSDKASFVWPDPLEVAAREALDQPFNTDIAAYMGNFPRELQFYQVAALRSTGKPHWMVLASALYTAQLIASAAAAGFAARMPACVVIALLSCYEAARYEKSINRVKYLFSQQTRDLYGVHTALAHAARPFLDALGGDDPRLDAFNKALHAELARR